MAPASPALPPALLAWYRAARRDLPWRGLADPYAVWVSEIMLQQTRIETVKGYFARFLEAFPTLRDLAAAPEDRVLKLWEGLGYYSRARNLQAAAKRLAALGRFPRSAAEWADLPGVGPYTAAALASICCGEPEPVVDGNVMRVAARLRAKSLDPRAPAARKEVARWLRPAIEAGGTPGDFNEAMMELGETICLPSSPDCPRCPLASLCAAFRKGMTRTYPAKPAKRERPVRKFAAFLAQDADGLVLLRRRPAHGLLAGLWELPMAEVGSRPSPARLPALAAEAGLVATRFCRAPDVVHDFTHFRQTLHVWRALDAVPGRPGLVFARPADLAVATATAKAILAGGQAVGGV